MTLVSSFLEVLQHVASVMPEPTFASFLILIAGWVFARLPGGARKPAR